MGKKKSKEQINDMLQEEIFKAQALGFELLEINREVGYSDNKRIYGCCLLRKNKATIVLNKKMRKHKKAEIRAVIMHEILHAVKGNKGHGREWKNCVREVVKNFDYKGYEDCHLCEHPYSKKRPLPRKRKK